MSPVRYDDFEVEVRSSKKEYEVRVLKSLRGRAASKFVLPYPAERLDEILSALEGRVCTSARAARDMEWETSAAPMDPLEVDKLGRKLFQALFPTPVEKRFREALSALHERNGGRQDWGLRVKVTFDREGDFALLATQPWEFLCDGGQFLNRHRLTPVVRCLNTDLRPLPPMTGPLRVLLIASNPQDAPSLKVRQEAKLIEKALRKEPEVEVISMPRASFRDLFEMAEQPFHVVHFMGHGDILSDLRDDFVLYFEGKDRRAEPINGLLFADCLRSFADLRLVVLNSCWSGAFSRRDGQDPFSGVAAALISRGIPAVVAMQFPISDDAAISFSRAFYERLVKNEFVSTAATAGRQAILAEEPESLEWATPVVFLAGKDVRFNVTSKAKEGPVDSPPGGRPSRQSPGAPIPVRLAIRSFQDPYLGDNQTPDDLLDLTPFFNGRYIKEAALWRTEVYPRLADFLRRYEKERKPLVLDFAAHLTIAFAAGYCLEAKSGLQTTVLQRSQKGVERWKAEAGPARPGPLWRNEADLELNPKSAAVAIAISATHDITGDVNFYLKKSHKAVGRLVPAMVYPKPSSTSVEDGQHALQLAQDLSLKIRERSFEERRRPLHLFTASPNAILFFLGQLSRSFGAIQLYEHDFPSRKPGAYIPSLLLPVP